MNNSEITYFEKEDILYFLISDEPEVGSVEISPNITAELNEAGELIGIEIIDASSYLWHFMLDFIKILLKERSESET
jgi:uncharacterized protein YuzE